MLEVLCLKTNNLNSRTLLAYLLFFQVIVCITIVFDIPYFRQVLGFIFFTIVPGLVFLQLLGIKRSSITETIILAVGLSLIFLMIIGAIINELGSMNYISDPLSTGPICIVTNIFVIFLYIISYFRNKGSTGFSLDHLEKIWFLLPILALPLLSVSGVLLILYFNNIILLVIFFILVPVILVYSSFRSQLSLYYPFIIFSIVLALVLSNTLLSNYIYGADTHGEFNSFMATKTGSYWNPLDFDHYQEWSDNYMMSITVLPTVLSNLLNIGASWIFKLIFPIFYSLVPVGLYHLYQKQWSERTALISAFFFIANYNFFIVVLTNAKQMIGTLFYVILFLILFSKIKNNNQNNVIVFFLACLGLIVSHYSMAYLFIAATLFTWFIGKFLLKNVRTKITTLIVTFSLSLTFLWYMFLAQGPLLKIEGVIRRSIESFLTEFFLFEARGSGIQQALGIVSRPSELHYVGTLLYDLTILLIMTGFISILIKRKQERKNPEIFLLMTFSAILLFSAVIIPRFASFLELGRLYIIALIFLSPLFAIGAKSLFNIVLNLRIRTKTLDLRTKKKRANYVLALTLLVLIMFYLFQTGFIYEVTNDPEPSSIALSESKMENSTILLQESDVFSAIWLSTFGNVQDHWTFSDRVSLDHVLNSYSTIDRSMLLLLSNTTDKVLAGGTYVRTENRYDLNSNVTYIYLSEFNVVKETITWWPAKNLYFHLSEIPVLNSTEASINKIYSNSLSEVYYRIP